MIERFHRLVTLCCNKQNVKGIIAKIQNSRIIRHIKILMECSKWIRMMDNDLTYTDLFDFGAIERDFNSFKFAQLNSTLSNGDIYNISCDNLDSFVIYTVSGKGKTANEGYVNIEVVCFTDKPDKIKIKIASTTGNKTENSEIISNGSIKNVEFLSTDSDDSKSRKKDSAILVDTIIRYIMQDTILQIRESMIEKLSSD